MAVNTAALKTFAPAMRRQLLEAVGRKLDLLLHSQTPDTLSTYAKQIAELREQEGENRDQLLERVAYTWFNRLCALRYLDARGWHPFGCKVLMPAAEGETQPELLKLMRAGSLPAALKGHANESRLHGLLDGQIQTAIAGADPQGEVYRGLVLATCRFYHELLPNLFEGLDDASELLLPDDLLSEGSIAGSFRREINDDDCQDVEILGWLYQFYIAEKKDEVMARKKAVPTEDIPAVTQLFTPHWIVRYLVENSLGRLWLLNRPSSKLREQMPYYIEGEAETDFLKINKPEEIKVLDPACGSGHMLTYAFDLLALIYEEEGYAPNEIPGLILQHNLHGLEICPRAAQLAEVALVFKAREKSRRFFQPEQLAQPHVIELQDICFEEDELNTYIEALDLGELFDQDLFKLLGQFEDAKNFGSLIQPCLDESSIADARHIIQSKELGDQLFLRETHLKVLRVLGQAQALTQRYHVVVANPPYMGQKQMNSVLVKFVSQHLLAGKADLYGAFILRNQKAALPGGNIGMITIPNWMFLSSFESLRCQLLQNCHLTSLLHNGRGVWGGDFGSVSFVYTNSPAESFSGSYIRLFKKQGEIQPGEAIEANFRNRIEFPSYRASGSDFKKIPGFPIAYWIQDGIRQAFQNEKIANNAVLFQGIITGNNELFVRQWWESNYAKIHLNAESIEEVDPESRYWVPYNKGGESLRWYGNQDLVVNFTNKGRDFTRGKHQFYEYFFKPCFSWTYISSTSLATRYFPGGFIWDVHGSSAFPRQEEDIYYFMSLIGSVVGRYLLGIINPTISFQVENIAAVPAIYPSKEDKKAIVSGAIECIEFAKRDWDGREISWGFRDLSFLQLGLKGDTLGASWRNWEVQSTATIRRMQELETENNRLFIAAYGLEGELEPEVPEDRITLARADQRKDLVAFLTYATGCMMGRYSLYQPGLILADSRDSQDAHLAAYEDKVGKPITEVQFKPDPDGIIPVLDGEWFEDDIVARTREFLEVTFPESTVTENLRFIEESLGKDIRKYFCSDFYKDHLQTYKKRPIYWMVQSPKKGFACLIYLHRYTKDTLNQVLNNYFRPYLQKLEARLAQLGLDQLNDDLPTRERTAARKEAEKITKVLKECQAWEQDALLPLAQQRIELDLDDGVKVNYLKLQDVLAPIPGLAAKED
jgi:hypothetical protein